MNNRQQQSSVCLFDDFPLRSWQGVVREVKPVEKLGPVTLPFRAPGRELISLFGSVLHDAMTEKYRMYYLRQSLDCPSPIEYWMVGAESCDGLHWTLPKAMGRLSRDPIPDRVLCKGLGSEQQVLIPSVFRSPLTGKWEMFAWVYGGVRKMRGPRIVRNVKAISEDGWHWKVLNIHKPCFYHIGDHAVFARHIFPEIAPEMSLREFNRRRHKGDAGLYLRGNDASYTYFDSIQRKYYTYGVWLMPNPGGKRNYGFVRVIMRRESLDEAGLVWSSPEMIFVPDEQDPIDQQLYYMAVNQWNGCYLGLVGAYRMKSQTIDVRLAVSRDNRHWQFPTRQSLISRGNEDHSMNGMLFASHHMIDAGQYWHIYYSAHSYQHNIVLSGPESYAPLKCGIYLARIRKDRMVSLSAGKAGEIWTQPFYLERNHIQLNYRCFSGGSIRVALCDAFGKPYRGYGFNDCCALHGTESIVQWKKIKPGGLISEAVSLRVQLKNAELFGWSLPDEDIRR